MNIEALLTSIFVGSISIAILSVLLQPNGATASVISSTAKGFSQILTAAKATPGAYTPPA